MATIHYLSQHRARRLPPDATPQDVIDSWAGLVADTLDMRSILEGEDLAIQARADAAGVITHQLLPLLAAAAGGIRALTRTVAEATARKDMVCTELDAVALHLDDLATDIGDLAARWASWAGRHAAVTTASPEDAA